MLRIPEVRFNTRSGDPGQSGVMVPGEARGSAGPASSDLRVNGRIYAMLAAGGEWGCR